MPYEAGCRIQTASVTLFVHAATPRPQGTSRLYSYSSNVYAKICICDNKYFITKSRVVNRFKNNYLILPKNSGLTEALST